MASPCVDRVTASSDEPRRNPPAAAELPEPQVILRVTPDLQPIPGLKSVLLADQLRGMARGKLVDPGGVMPVAADATALAPIHPNGFVSAAVAAFANHFPLQLRPQHIHLLILQAIAEHVGKQPEALRSKWVKHEGKMELNVQRDHFVLGSANDWATVISEGDDSFGAQILAHVVEELPAQLNPPLSGTTPTERIAGAVTVMDICKHYFSYKVSTMCGFPSVVLSGSLDDWQLLRRNTEALLEDRCDPEFAERWGAALLQLLDKFAEEYAAGAEPDPRPADERFWNSMCKRGGIEGSGAYSWFSGWINIFFPYIPKKVRNIFCVPYSASNDYVAESGRLRPGAAAS
jgi:hypothetical protein